MSQLCQSCHGGSISLHQAAHKLCKRVPSHFYTLQLLQRNYQIDKKAHTSYAFGTLEKDAKRIKGGTGWTVQLALDQGKEVYLFDIPSQTWYRSENQRRFCLSGDWEQVFTLGSQTPYPSSKQCCGWFPRS